MTRTQSGANWSGIPSLSQLLLAALLRLTAMFVQGVVSPLRMLLSRLPRECHTDVTPDRLPATESGNHTEEPDQAAANSHSQEGLMLRDREAIVSKREAGLAGARDTSRNSADALLPRAGEAQGAQADERSGSGGGPPYRLTTAPPVPHRIGQASRPAHASLPRSGGGKPRTRHQLDAARTPNPTAPKPRFRSRTRMRTA
jgi:hypothetical protein